MRGGCAATRGIEARLTAVEARDDKQRLREDVSRADDVARGGHMQHARAYREIGQHEERYTGKIVTTATAKRH